MVLVQVVVAINRCTDDCGFHLCVDGTFQHLCIVAINFSDEKYGHDADMDTTM